jgi:UrcA family protein
MTYVNKLSMCAAMVVVGGSLAIASPAQGKTAPVLITAPADVVVRHVSYADLNLASAPGQQRLNHRVDAAVTDVCLEATGGDNGSTEFKFSMVRCASGAWNDARPQINLAIQRAHELASTGTTNLAAAAITFTVRN